MVFSTFFPFIFTQTTLASYTYATKNTLPLQSHTTKLYTTYNHTYKKKQATLKVLSNKNIFKLCENNLNIWKKHLGWTTGPGDT